MVGSNAVLAVAGPLDVDATLRTIAASAFASLPPGQRVPRPAIVPPKQVEPSLTWQRDGGDRVKFTIGFRCPGRSAPPRTLAALDVLLALLDGGESARLPALRTAEGRAYTMSAEGDEAGLLLISSDADRGELADAVWDVLSVLTDLAAHGPSGDELLRAKRLLALDAASEVETPESIAERLADSRLRGVDEVSPSVEHKTRMAVSARDVRHLARQVVRADHLAIVFSGEWTEADRRDVEDAVAEATERWSWEPSRVIAALEAQAAAVVVRLARHDPGQLAHFSLRVP